MQFLHARVLPALFLGLLLVLPCRAQQAPAVVAPASEGPSLRDRLSLTRTASPLSSTRAVGMRFALNAHESVQLQAGYTRFSSFPNDRTVLPIRRQDWKMRAVPITAEYTRTLADPNRRIVPTASAGASVYLSRLKLLPRFDEAEAAFATDAEFFETALNAATTRHMGVGYGLHAALGLRANLDHGMFVLAQTRLRFVDGLGLTAPTRDAAFSKLDFVVGVGYRF